MYSGKIWKQVLLSSRLRAAPALGSLVSLQGGRDPGGSMAPIAQDQSTGLDEFKFIFRKVLEVFCSLT